MKVNTIERDSDGKLPAFAWPGGYPIFYLDRGGNVLCAQCADKSLKYDDNQTATDCDIYYEGEPIQCEDCNAIIESAYGDPVTDDERSNGPKRY